MRKCQNRRTDVGDIRSRLTLVLGQCVMRPHVETRDVLDSVIHVTVIDSVHCRCEAIGNGLGVMFGKPDLARPLRRWSLMI